MARQQRRRPRTRAEQLRRHREELQLALAQGLSLDDARRHLDSYRDHASRLIAPIGATVSLPPPVATDRPLQWWQRD